MLREEAGGKITFEYDPGFRAMGALEFSPIPWIRTGGTEEAARRAGAGPQARPFGVFEGDGSVRGCRRSCGTSAGGAVGRRR